MEKLEIVKSFLREVRAELKKVTWVGRKEVVSGTIAVLFMSAVVSLFLMAVDWSISSVVRLVLS